MAVCVDCASYSVCKVCLETGTHGHHPGHSYRTKTEPRKSYIDPSYLEPMFHKDHHAVCDNCDKVSYQVTSNGLLLLTNEQHIRGVRHKCLDCPDFDLCNGCIGRAADLHQDHRFVPVYADITPSAAEKSRHRGIFCDGPLCIGKPPNTYIRGIRYKCAICQDLDFCEDCESSPKNDHNKTHPLVKFRTPVQNASIETIEGKNENEVLRMGDPCAPARLAVEATSKPDVSVSRQRPVQNNTPFNQLDAPDGTPKSRYENSARLMNKLRAVAELRKQPDATPLYEAIFLFDLVHDGTHFLPEQHFTQQWTVKNPGPLSWPVGCYVEYVGGEGRHMVPCQTGDLNRSELRTTLRSEGTSCEVEAGQECDFSVTLRAPATLGKKISYWRVCDPKGERFGHKLWCDIVVVDPVMEKLGNAAVRRHEHPSGVLNVAADRSFDAERAEFRRRLDAIRAKRATEASSTIDASKLRMDSPLESISKSSSDSQLLFPKLEKESPQSSMLTHMTAVTTAHIPNVTAETKAISPTSNVSDHGSLAVENPKAVQVLAELVDKLEEVNLKDTKAKDDDLLGSDVEYETIGDGSDETDEDCEWNTDDEYEILDGSEGRSA